MRAQPYKFRHPSGRFISVEFDFLPGKRISTGTHDEAEAVIFAESYLASKGLAKIESITLSQYADSFYLRNDPKSFQARQRAFNKTHQPELYQKKQAFLDNYILPYFGGFKIDSITSNGVEDWIISLRGKKKENLAADTKNKILIAFSEVMASAMKDGYIKSNPLDQVPCFTVGDPANSRRALTWDEQAMLFPASALQRVSVWGNQFWALYFSIMYDTGFRPSEAAGLRVCDVWSTMNGLAVYTTHTVSAKGKAQNRVKTSGKGLEQRAGLLSAVTAELMKDYIIYHKLSENDYLFTPDRMKKDKLLTADSSNSRFKAVCAKHHIEDVVQYSIRHTFETYKRGNMDEGILALAMGHAGGRARDDYDHRSASLLISQLEKSRQDIFQKKPDDLIKPLKIGK